METLNPPRAERLRTETVAGAAALAAGVMLSLMVHLNGELARWGGVLFSSWMAHGTGTLAALLILPLWWKAAAGVFSSRRPTPYWAYLGGIAGAVTVMMTSSAVNTPLALSGTLALGLAGQIVFSLAADRWGFFEVPRRRLRMGDAVALLLIGAGSALVIWGSL